MMIQLFYFLSLPGSSLLVVALQHDRIRKSDIDEKTREEILSLIAHHVTAVNYIYRNTKFDGRFEHRNIRFEVSSFIFFTFCSAIIRCWRFVFDRFVKDNAGYMFVIFNYFRFNESKLTTIQRAVNRTTATLIHSAWKTLMYRIFWIYTRWAIMNSFAWHMCLRIVISRAARSD